MKKAIGWAILIFIFTAIAVFAYSQGGWMAIIPFGGVAVIVGLIYLAVSLIGD